MILAGPAAVPSAKPLLWLVGALVLAALARQAWALLPASSSAEYAALNVLMPLPINALSSVLLWQVARTRAVDAWQSWAWLGVAMLCFFLGDVIYALLSLRGINPFPSLADAFYIACELLMLVALLRLPRPPFRRLEVARVFLSVAIIVLGVVMLCWYLVLGKAVENHAGQWVPLALALVYPTCNLGFFAFLLLYVLRTSSLWLGAEVLLLTCGLGVMIVADASYVWRCFSVRPDALRLTEHCADLLGPALHACEQRLALMPMPEDWPLAAGWQWAAMFFGLAAFWDYRTGFNAMMVRGGLLGQIMDAEALEGTRRRVAQLATTHGIHLAVALAFVLYILTRAQNDLVHRGVELLGGVMIALVVARQFVALSDNQRLTKELRELSDQLEARVAQRTHELSERSQQLEQSQILLRASAEADQGRNEVLEMIARDQPIEQVVWRLASLFPDVPSKAGAPDNAQLRDRLLEIAMAHHGMTERLAHQARHDALTGLPNRVFVQDLLERALTKRGEVPAGQVQLSVMFIDLDRFKQINDTLGHPVGDRLLIAVAERFGACLQGFVQSGVVSESAVLGRTGGDEFVIVLPEAHDPNVAFALGQEITARLKHPILLGEHELYVGSSIGLACCPDDGSDSSTLMRHADTAMYHAKSSKSGLQRHTSTMNALAAEKLQLENDLRQAIERQELALHHQPIMELHSGKLIGFECLLRWHHGKYGLIAPSKFIPLAEECGLILPIGNWVLEEACRQHAMWRRAGLPAVRLAVNVSAAQFDRPDFPETIMRVLQRWSLPANQLELELVESTVLRDVENSVQRMQELRNLGVRIAMDDFGTGYSSLAYLQRLPIDTLKIDRQFVRSLEGASTGSRTQRSLPLVRAILTLAESLELNVVAEGVEHLEQLQTLEMLGCKIVQGYYFSPPVNAGSAAVLLEQLRQTQMLN